MNSSYISATISKWHDWLREQGCSIQESYTGPDSIHHIIGAKANLKGVDKFGEKYVLCLNYWVHQDGRNPAVRHPNKKQFVKKYGTEKELFLAKCEQYKSQYGHYPFCESDIQIIKDRA